MALKGARLTKCRKVNTTVEIEATPVGDWPVLPPWTSSTTVYASEQEFIDAIKAAEATIADLMPLYTAGQAYKVDPTLGAIFQAAGEGKGFGLDLTGVAGGVIAI